MTARKAILPPWILYLALATGAILGLILGLSDPQPSVEERIIHEYQGRKS